MLIFQPDETRTTGNNEPTYLFKCRLVPDDNGLNLMICVSADHKNHDIGTPGPFVINNNEHEHIIHIQYQVYIYDIQVYDI